MSNAARPAPVEEGPSSEERATDLDPRDRIRAAMDAAPEVNWLSPEERAACDESLENLRAGRAQLSSREEMLEALAELSHADGG